MIASIVSVTYARRDDVRIRAVDREVVVDRDGGEPMLHFDSSLGQLKKAFGRSEGFEDLEGCDLVGDRHPSRRPMPNDAQDIHAAVKVYQWALEQSERILGRMSSLGLTAEIVREALHLEAERPTREQVATLTAVLDRVLSDPRVHVDGDGRRVVLDAMVAAGLGDHTPSER